MNVCIPIETNNALDSAVCAHFGSAPSFLVVDTETGSCREIINNNEHHAHGQCTPIQLLQNQQIDGMVVSGIGMGALRKLSALSIKVYVSQYATVGEVVAAFKAGSLELMQPGMTCAQHGKHGHSHP